MKTMEGTSAQVVVDVILKPNDVYTPFQWDRHNLARWVAGAAVCWIFYYLFQGPLLAFRSFPDSRSIIAANAIIAAILVILVVFILLALLLSPYLQMRALFRKSPQFQKSVRYTFNLEGLRFESESASGVLKWSAFDRVVETRKVFAFSISSRSGTYIPKRCLASPTDVSLLRQLIRDNFKGKWTLRRD
jgi:hypothetical protein